VIKRICVAFVAALMLFHPLAAQASEPVRKAEHVSGVTKYPTGGGFEVTTDQVIVPGDDHQVLVCVLDGHTVIGQGIVTIEAEAQYIADGTCRVYVESESNIPTEVTQ
jgi:hypothetical protein